MMKDKPDGKKLSQFCTFRISGHLFGINILQVKEINQEATFTSIYHAPEEINGYVNIRGQIYLIMDLRRILGFPSKPVDRYSRVVLFKPEIGESFGVLVDQVGDVVTVEDRAIEIRSSASCEDVEDEEKTSWALEDGVCKLERGLLVILNPRSLRQFDDLIKTHSTSGIF